jgi:haloacid dehalogenase superfamily, subfamily IA, variant 3 with third motif having DD or ED/haloacid dehalogenase superfamily, subfamily IA, variant 1 with third motif having Dx(3-4)D or Dx(3-4)E
MKFKYALFDLDMTLIDSITPLMVSANLLAEKFGLPKVSYEEVWQAETSQPNVTFESLWAGLWGRCDPGWYDYYRDNLTEAEYEVMSLYPGGREMLEGLAQMKVPTGLASNRDYPRKALKGMGIEHFFQAVVGQYDVVKPKPAPDIILKAMEQMKAPAEELLYICDSTGDILAAEAAGVRTLSMTSGGHSAEKLLELGAWRIGENLIEVLDYFR